MRQAWCHFPSRSWICEILKLIRSICKSECMHDTTRRSTRFYSWMFITQAFQNFYMIYRRFPKQARFPGRGGVWGVLGLIFAGYVPLVSLRTPAPSILWPIIDPVSVTFRQICNFRYPNLVTFYFY